MYREEFSKKDREMIRIVIVEDDKDFIYLIEEMLADEKDIEVIGSYDEGICDELPALFYSADLVILDLNLSDGIKGGMGGIKIAKKIRSCTNAKILILTGYEDPEIVLSAGRQTFASGYLLKKDHKSLPFTIRKIIEGNSPEEVYICSALLQKLSYAERFVLMEYLGYEVDIHSSAKTKSNQMSSIVQKFGLDRPADLVRIFRNYPDLSKLNEELG